MPTNFYFQSGNTSGTTNEQRLLEDLVIESMKIYGHDVYYLPRTIANEDPILFEEIYLGGVEMLMSESWVWTGLDEKKILLTVTFLCG